ncbi:MAG: ABC transporter substrate-binding protein [Thermoprotei archaeon]|nr:MAG: ABC transporter substrate-binding protein [Thermoprotei archaeon]
MLSEEVVEISLRSLFVSSTATFMALAWSVPTAYRLSASYSRLSRIIIGICNALVSLPTVIVGLFLYMLFSRTGPLGIINLLYTPYAIILGESILITPLLISLFHDVFRDYRGKYWEMALSLGATSRQAATLVIREALPRLVTASLIGFARAISELGVALMVGGNIRGYTRVLTTSIALEVAKGEFETAIVLGLILLAIVTAIVLTIRAIKVFME